VNILNTYSNVSFNISKNSKMEIYPYSSTYKIYFSQKHPNKLPPPTIKQTPN
jgi:hypothetical protein